MNHIKTFKLVSIFLILHSCVPLVSTGGIISLGMSAAKDKTVGQSIDDTAISNKIKKEFITKGFKKLYAKINVEVCQGRVLYTGVVENDEDIMKAIDIAWNQEGVKEVINELELDEQNSKFSAAQYTKDAWITTQVKSKIFAQRKVKFVNYTVVTTRNIVYLFGVARSEEELQQVADIAATVKGVEKVISRVIVKSSDHEAIHPTT